MVRARYCWLFLAAASLLAIRPAGADDTPAQKELRARREAMTAAMNAHKGKEVVAFFDPSFVWTTKDGQTIKYKEAVAAIEKEVNESPASSTVTLKIDKVETMESIKLTVTETFTATDAQGNKQSNSAKSVETWKKIDGRWMLVKNET